MSTNVKVQANENIYSDSDSDDEDDSWLKQSLHKWDIRYRPAAKRAKLSCCHTPITFNEHLREANRTSSSPSHCPVIAVACPTKNKEHRHRRLPIASHITPLSKCNFHVHDDVIIQHQLSFEDTVVLNCQILSIKCMRDGTRIYHLMSENARPNDARIILSESEMHNSQKVRPWKFVEHPTVLTEALVECATAYGVSIVPTKYGNGLCAIHHLSAGHMIPYWGKLSAIQRDGGMYNAEIIEGVFVIADEPQHRGPATFCNDNTVHVHNNGLVVKNTKQQANAKLTWTIPRDDYLDDWKNNKNDGSEFAMYVELLHDIRIGEEISVCYGKNGYWQDTEVGNRMSNAIAL